MKRIITKIGDLFSVEIDENQVKYFQYIADDLTQLNSSVIRVFKEVYQKKETLDWNEVVKGAVEFYTHTILKVGIKLEHWKKAGKSSEVGTCEAIFRSSGDTGNPKITISKNWYVWKVNQPKTRIGKLEGEYRNAELGAVFPSIEVITRIRTGEPYKEYIGF